MSFDPLLGTQVGPYRLLGLLGVGGMSRVYVGRHMHLGRRAAVKLLAPHLVGDSQSVSRFFHEARAAAEAQSPHIVEIYDFIWEPKLKLAAYIMELLRGRDLRATLQSEKSLAPARAARIGADVCRALSVLHTAGVVHRDIKPENIFVCEGPVDNERAKLLDLGIAKFGAAPVAHKTMLGAAVGSPWYMSPEQAGACELDGRADLYALGVVLFEMLSGKLPFTHEKMSEIQRMHLELAPPRLSGPIGDIVWRCMQKRPDDRFASARELERALHALDREDALNLLDRSNHRLQLVQVAH
jgi:serine/threonine-protein kinase